jgi:hypothetical protein
MFARPLAVVPQQPERLRGECDNRRVEVEHHYVLAFQPGLETHMLAGGGGPPDAWEVPLAFTGREASDGMPMLERNRPSGSQRLLAP